MRGAVQGETAYAGARVIDRQDVGMRDRAVGHDPMVRPSEVGCGNVPCHHLVVDPIETEMDGITNFRGIGGLPTTDGRTTGSAGSTGGAESGIVSHEIIIQISSKTRGILGTHHIIV